MGGSQVIPDGTVLAVRSVTLSSIGTLVPAASTDRYYLAAGATWAGVSRTAAPSFPRMCRDRDPATSGARGHATEVPAATEIRAIQNSEQLAMRTGVHLAGVEVLTGLRVELVKLGSDVLPESAPFP